jgi:RHS repeat-associated protein
MKFFQAILMRLALLLCAVASLGATAAGTVTYYHNDLLGSPVAATNSTGQVIWRESYRPYGERITNDANSASNKVWFTSRRQDAETGLVYMGARYYDPVMGRFLSIDPAGFDEKNIHSHNRYAYANNNPYRFADPDGRQAAAVAGATGALLIVGGGYMAATDAQRLVLLTLLARASQFTVIGQLGGLFSNVIANEQGPVHDVFVPSDKYPEAAGHIQDAQDSGQPDVLTIDRGGAAGRRADAMRGQPVVPGKDRDEYPPAMFGEGGTGASVRPIAPGDNRGAGACVGAQCSDLPDGSRVRIIPE